MQPQDSLFTGTPSQAPMQPQDSLFTGTPSQAPMQYGGPQIVYVATSSNGMATAGGILSIVTVGLIASTPFLIFPICFAPITLLLGIIFSHIGLSNSKYSGEGKGMAITGLVIGYLILAPFMMLFVVILGDIFG